MSNKWTGWFRHQFKNSVYEEQATVSVATDGDIAPAAPVLAVPDLGTALLAPGINAKNVPAKVVLPAKPRPPAEDEYTWSARVNAEWRAKDAAEKQARP